jgi:hypothetical protein
MLAKLVIDCPECSLNYHVPFDATVTRVLKLLLVHFTQAQIYLCCMLKEIGIFYEKHEKQMRHCNICCLILYIGSVWGHVPSFLCQKHAPPPRWVQTTRVCARSSARASADATARDT